MTDERIIIDPEIQHGKPIITGTRVPVARILGLLAAGVQHEEIFSEFGITQADLSAALSFAARIVEEEQFHS